MKEVYIIHGYYASPEDHWFPWLESKLQKQGVKVSRIHLPDSKEPRLNTWIETLQHKVRLNKSTYIIAHSLGCITAARYILQNTTQIGGAIFVSGFDDRLPNYPNLNEFVENLPEMQQLAALVSKKLTLVSENDSIVPAKLTKRFAEHIQSPLIHFENAGHFLASDGFTELQVVYDAISEMLHD